jgi:phage baseplate assembly protein W
MNWDPTAEEEIAQNVRSIVATGLGTQPLARAVGLENLTDRPVQVASAKLAAALAAQIKAYEPRAEVASISVTATVDGALSPTVRLK